MHPLIKFLLFYVLMCLEQNGFGSEIINGQKADDKSMQYMAFLEGDGSCGGFLISEDFVLTAAHCDGMTTVVLGTHNLKKTDKNTKYRVKKECKHPGYNGKTLINDIMLIKLSRKAQLGKNIKLIKIPTGPKHLKPKQKCTVAGWGDTKTNGITANELLFVDLSVIDPKQCLKEWRALPPNVICAGGYGTNKGTCQGDSGGPLVCNGVAVGVVSFGEKKCEHQARPEVYTDISKFLPWINNILKKKNC